MTNGIYSAFQDARAHQRYRVYFRRVEQNIFRWDAFDTIESAHSWYLNLVHESKHGRRLSTTAAAFLSGATVEIKWYSVTVIDMTPGRDDARDQMMQLGGAPPEPVINNPIVREHWSVDGTPPPDLLLEMLVSALTTQ